MVAVRDDRCVVCLKDLIKKEYKKLPSGENNLYPIYYRALKADVTYKGNSLCLSHFHSKLQEEAHDSVEPIVSHGEWCCGEQ